MTISASAFEVLIWLSILASALLMSYIVRFVLELKRNDLW